MRISTLCLLAALSPALVFDARAGTLKVPKQFATIQAAVDAAAPGDIIQIAAGTYPETVLIQSKHSVDLRVQGKVVVDAAGLFGPAVQITSATGIRLRGLRVVNASTTGIRIYDSTAIVLQDCRIEDAGGHGIYVHGGSSAVSIEGARVHGTVLAGVQADAGSSVGVRDGRFEEIGGPGVVIGSSSVSSFVVGNRFEGTASPAIHVSGTGHLVADNRVLGASATTIKLEGTSHLALENRGSAMIALSGVGQQVVSNDVAAAGQPSIGVISATDAVVYGNRADELISFGVYDAGTRTLAASNRFTHSDATALMVAGSTDAFLSANRVKQAYYGLGVLAASSGTSLVGNRTKKSAFGDLYDETLSPTTARAGNSFDVPSAVRHVPGDHATIQAAIAAAAPGDRIVVKKGTYVGSVILDGKHDLELRAEGKVVIDASGGGSGLVIRHSTGIVVDGFRSVAPGLGGFDVQNSRGVLLDGCVAEASGDYGFYIYQGSRGVTLRKCRAIDAGVSGVEVTNASGVHVMRCRVEGAGNHSIRLRSGTSGCVLEQNRIARKAGVVALELDGQHHVVDGTRVTGSPNGLPIRLRGTANTLIRTRVAGTVKVEGARHRILDNRLTKGPAEGILLKGADDCIVAGNVILRPTWLGIYLTDGASRNLVLSNRVVRSGSNGIFVVLVSNDNVVEGNVVRSAGGNGITCGAGVSGNALLRNSFKKSDDLDIWDNAAPGNNAWVGNAYGSASLP